MAQRTAKTKKRSASRTRTADAAPGAARAMWKASLHVGSVEVPVKLYAAIEDRGVHFRLLDARHKLPVRQRMIDPNTNEEVEADEIQRGFGVEPGVFVILTPTELEAAAVKPSRTIEILRFVPADAIDYAWYERPYYLGPDGSAAAYAALREALIDARLRGIARWTMRGERYFGVLEARDAHLTLIAMRSAGEVVAARDLPVAETKATTAAERDLANQLVAALEGDFDPAELRDDYRERVLAFIAAKAKGRRPRAAGGEKIPKPQADLARALKQSLQGAKRKRRAA